MKTSYVIIITLMLGASLVAQASDKEEKPTPEPQLSVGETPAMSEIPTMKQQGQRMAVLMERILPVESRGPEEIARLLAVYREAYGRRWAANHHIHHYHPDRNFGVSTPLWDIVLGTRHVSKRAAKRP